MESYVALPSRTRSNSKLELVKICRKKGQGLNFDSNGMIMTLWFHT